MTYTMFPETTDNPLPPLTEDEIELSVAAELARQQAPFITLDALIEAMFHNLEAQQKFFETSVKVWNNLDALYTAYATQLKVSAASLTPAQKQQAILNYIIEYE